MRLSSHGITAQLPTGWDGRVFRRTPDDGSVAYPILHAASFALPLFRGDYGSGAVDAMRPGDLLVVLFDHGPDAVGTPLFPDRGLPRPRAADFNPQQLQRTLPGQTGFQRFFTWRDRAFCLYVVLGSHDQRGRLVPRLHEVLDGLSVERGRRRW